MSIPNRNILRSTKLALLAKDRLTEDVYAFHFKPQQPLKHRAGQSGLLTVPGGGTRFLTPSSSPNDDEVVFATRIHADSTFKQALVRLKSGDTVKFRGPFIGATPEGSIRPRVVFLTQGIGITPHRSSLRSIADNDPRVHTTLIHVDGSGHPFRDETATLATEAYFLKGSDEFRQEVSAVARNQPDAVYYVAGGLRFSASTLRQLRQLGVKSSAIHHDRLPNRMNRVVMPYNSLTDWRRKRA